MPQKPNKEKKINIPAQQVEKAAGKPASGNSSRAHDNNRPNPLIAGVVTPDQAQMFLRTLAATCDVSAACRAAMIPRKLAYRHKQSDPEFAAAWADAKEQAIDSLEGVAYRRAATGDPRLQFIRSGPMAGSPIIDPATGDPYVERDYSDALMIKLLAAHRPEVYAERARVELSGTVNTGVITAPDELLAYVHGALPGFMAALQRPLAPAALPALDV